MILQGIKMEEDFKEVPLPKCTKKNYYLLWTVFYTTQPYFERVKKWLRGKSASSERKYLCHWMFCYKGR